MDLYTILLATLFFVLGVAIGSFLNVVIYRLGSKVGLTGRSKCLSCGKKLTARMLVPLASYLFQRGRCAYCRTRLSTQYFFVELAAGLFFIAAASVNGLFDAPFTIREGVLALLDALIWSTLILVTVYDLRHKIIPDRLSFIFALLAGTTLLLQFAWGMRPEQYPPFLVSLPSWIDFAAGPLLALPFAALWFFSGGRAMGFGDAKLAWGIGWFLGFTEGVSALILAFWIAFIPSLLLLFLSRKRFTMKSEIPFAPFLVLGTVVAYCFGVDILSWTF